MATPGYKASVHATPYDPHVLESILEDRTPPSATTAGPSPAVADAFALLTCYCSDDQVSVLRERLAGHLWDDIARHHGISNRSVRTRVARALANIERAVTDHGPELSALLGFDTTDANPLRSVSDLLAI